MSASSQPSAGRPRIVEIAFWVLVVGAAMLVFGGLQAATVSFDAMRTRAPASVSNEQLRDFLALYRSAGVGCALSGGGLAFLAGRARSGDARFRRATIGLAIAILVVFGLMAVFVGIHWLALLALLPIIVGTVMWTRPAAKAWFQSAGEQPSDTGEQQA